MFRLSRRTLGVVLTVSLGASLAACAPSDSADHSSDASSTREDAATAWANATLKKLSLSDKVGQLFIHYAYGESADTTDPAAVKKNQQLHGVDNASQLIDKYHLGGVIYFGWSNGLTDPKKIAGLSNGVQKAAAKQKSKIPLLVSTDQETGTVVRMGPPATEWPGAMPLGAGRSPDDAETAGAIAGAELRAVGINQDFAPDADVNVNPANPVIGVRSFGADPTLAASMVTAQVKGYQGKNGVTSTAKHFPGHGDTATDSHTDLPIINHTKKQWEKLDAPPFKAAIKAGIDSIMSAHIQFPALDKSKDPATLSKPILTGLLREKLGFDGLIVTDSLSMAGVRKLYSDKVIPVKALQAGADMLLMPPDLKLAINSVLAAVKDGKLTEKRIDQSVRRILKVKYMRGVVKNPYVDVDKVDSIVGTKSHKATASKITDKTTTLVKNDAKLLPLADSKKKILVAGAGDGMTAELSKKLTGDGRTATAYNTGTDPSSSTIDSAVSKAKDADAVVVATQTVGAHPAQAALVKALAKSSTPVAVVSVKEPYDINQFPDVDTYVSTYSYTNVALDSAARVLTGAVNPSGKLPVTIPTADDPDKALFKYGTGLRYS
ncbi:MAG TPA: glycoside hydrolase family 3 protein [Stackebrandtia sp.]|jgi:beta-N-acetylhexosaminidase|uniref:glycoside hydrolase family 3 protein n=1 Tax=Stackebrandtia sp. TaxID=2023065 RepID=UPI002D719340|nr:glycoside hydrolase family 3 protein [Stackebrandtia sp.]HZE40545.1 glycoside hydrolase family 3 protein [Stackebrandtia sp.]